MSKRKYTRRTDEQLIQDLQDKIKTVKTRMESKKRKDSPVMKELPKVQRSLRKFAQIALDNGREDLANSSTAFLAGLERAAKTVPDSLRNRMSKQVDENPA